MVHAALGSEFIRSGLIALLPRLRRLAMVLAGDREEGDALLGRACQVMLEGAERDRPPQRFDHWALGALHGLWLAELRRQKEPSAHLRADEDCLRALLEDWAAPELEVEEMAAFIAGLPPQQRAAVLLVYGEGLSYAEAAGVLDAPVETVASRTSRALGGLVERLSLQAREAHSGAGAALTQEEQDQALA